MNTAIASLGAGSIGIGFAIPAERVFAVAPQIISR
jgi:S1-C subfamily serine protease